jgi:hypothetical protein
MGLEPPSEQKPDEDPAKLFAPAEPASTPSR